MRRIKRIPAFLLAGVLLLSEAVYAAPETGAPAEEVAAELLRLEPREEAEVPVSVVDERMERPFLKRRLLCLWACAVK